MKFPTRLERPPLCYTFEQWATRMAISEIVCFSFVAGIFIWLTNFLEENGTDVEGLRTALIIASVFCIIQVVFSVVLLVGLYKKNPKLLLIWVIYTLVAAIIWTVLVLIGGIYIATLETVNGIIIIILAICLSVQMFYSILVVNTMRLDMKQQENTSEDLRH